MRTLRSKKLRAALYAKAGGKCQSCRCDLSSDWHADHIIPWSVTKRTNVHEMQALCPACNLKKGNRMADWALENENDASHRQGHIQAIETFRNWLSGGCKNRTFSIYMCCRYGKSDTIRNLALLALAERQACAALVVHPGTTLARQFLEPQRLKAWRQRWLPIGPRLAQVATLKDFAVQSMCNGEWLGSIHIQALMQPSQKPLALQWVKLCKERTGLSPIVFFDEAHQFSTENSWGDVAREFYAAGCLVVVLTATPFRNDRDDVFGFKKRKISEVKGKQLTYCLPSENEGKLIKHTSYRDETEYTIEADVEVPFSQGWGEKCIAKCTFDLLDWNMEGWGLGKEGDKKMLSELPQQEARKALPSIYRDPIAIKEAASKAISHVKAFRNGAVKDATFVWYGMNDEGDERSKNQKLVKACIKELDPGLKIAIATQSEDKGPASEKSDETILRFVDANKKHYDGLLLKQMGAAGLDSDRICVVVLWNTVRSLNQLIQMAMRGGNSQAKQHFVIIALADSMTSERLQAFVEGEGGKYIESTETDHKEEEIDIEERQESGYVAVDVAEAGMSDSDGDVASYEDVRLALAVIKKWPHIISHETIPKIAEAARSLGMSSNQVQADDELTFSDGPKEIERLCKNLNTYVKKIGQQRFLKKHGRKGTDGDQAEYGKIYVEVKSDIKRRAGVSGSWNQRDKKRSQKIADYLKWTQAADILLEEACSATYA